MREEPSLPWAKLAYAEGPRGAMILFVLVSLDGARWFHGMLLSLATGASNEEELTDRHEVQLIDKVALVLQTRFSGAFLSSIKRRKDNEFVWSARQESWREAAAMLEPFLRGESGHQYFGREYLDDASVEVTFGERHKGI